MMSLTLVLIGIIKKNSKIAFKRSTTVICYFGFFDFCQESVEKYSAEIKLCSKYEYYIFSFVCKWYIH